MKNYKMVHLSSSACMALGNIFRSGVLPLPVRKGEWSDTDREPADTGPACKLGLQAAGAEPSVDVGHAGKQPVREEMELMDIEGDGDNQPGSEEKKKVTVDVEMTTEGKEGSGGDTVKMVTKAELVQSLVSLSKSSPVDKVSFIFIFKP